MIFLSSYMLALGDCLFEDFWNLHTHTHIYTTFFQKGTYIYIIPFLIEDVIFFSFLIYNYMEYWTKANNKLPKLVISLFLQEKKKKKGTVTCLIFQNYLLLIYIYIYIYLSKNWEAIKKMLMHVSFFQAERN